MTSIGAISASSGHLPAQQISPQQKVRRDHDGDNDAKAPKTPERVEQPKSPQHKVDRRA